MSRLFASLALIVSIGGALLVQVADAQSSRRGRSLSERLEQFRDDVMGNDTSGRPESTDSESLEPIASPPKTVAPNAQPATGPMAGTAPVKPKSPSTSVPNAPRAAAKPAAAATAPAQANRSSRRTAQPGYKPAGTQPTLAAENDEPTKQEPTPAVAPPSAAPPLGKQPVADKRPTPRAAIDAAELPSPRLARSARPDLAPPAPDVSGLKAPKSKTVAGADVLFSGQSPLLSVEASGPRKVLIGKEALFTVLVRNGGDTAANNVLVTLNIPPFAEVVEAKPTAGGTRAPSGTERSEPFEWKISRLEAHSRETLILKIVPRKSIPIDLAVQWNCSPESSQALVEVQEPKLVMNLSGPEEVLYGQSKIYKLTISNPGNGDADNVMVSLLPIGRAAEGTASHRLGTLKAGESKAIEVELTARQAGALTIRAQAFADSGLRCEAAEQVLVRRANLHIEVEGPKVKYAGTTGTYRIHLTNPGDAMADNVQVSAILPPQAKYVSSNAGGRVEDDRGKVLWNAGNLQPGAERLLEVQCALQSAGENRVQVLATAEDDVSASANTSTRVEALADLKLEVRDPQGPIPVGEDTVYEVVIRNRGTKAADAIDLVVFFSEGLEATSVQGGTHEIGRGQVVFKTIPTLAAGSETVYRVHARADRSGNHVFRAEVVCETLQTRLAAEETTRFYGDEVGDRPTAGQVPAGNMPDLQPVPQE